ncbi:hypothetical protein HY78_14560 [Rhizorhabdus wittichii DC-6]|nr:hypothetical protein HY78_14560 [Rhizorhabdus wittichii DC-6]
MPSEPTLRKMIANDRDFEGIIKHGTNGDAYEIELDVAARYIAGLEAKKIEAQRERQQALAQLGLDLGLGAAAQQREPGFTIADRQALLEEEVVAMKLAKLRETLIDKASVETAVSTFLVKVKDLGSTFAARLAKRADLSRTALIEIERLMQDDQRAIARFMRELANLGLEHDDADNDGARSAGAPVEGSTA